MLPRNAFEVHPGSASAVSVLGFSSFRCQRFERIFLFVEKEKERTMVTKEICVVVVVVVLSFKTLDCKPTCPSGRYYDPVVGRCSPCADICFNAAIQRTETECRRKCPNFKAAGK